MDGAVVGRSWVDRFARSPNYETSEQGGAVSVTKQALDFAERGDARRWTFGMVTDGTRIDWLAENVETIRRMSLAEAQIVIAGDVRKLAGDRAFRGVELMTVDEGTRKGWITRKKNVIFEAAQFENICVLHDRILIETDFGKLGKDDLVFEISVGHCAFSPLGARWFDVRAQDWMSYGRAIEADVDARHYRTQGMLAPTEWSPYAYGNGSFFCVKKSVAREVPLDEELVWGEAEDVEWSHRALSMGFVTTFNPAIRLRTRVFKHPHVAVFPRGSMGAGAPKVDKRIAAVYLLAIGAGPVLRWLQPSFLGRSAASFFAEVESALLGDVEVRRGPTLSRASRLSRFIGDGGSSATFFVALYFRLRAVKPAHRGSVPFFSMAPADLVRLIYRFTHLRPPLAWEIAAGIQEIERDDVDGRFRFLKRRVCGETIVKHLAFRLFE